MVAPQSRRLRNFLVMSTGSGGDSDVVATPLPEPEFEWPASRAWDVVRNADSHVCGLIVARQRAFDAAVDDRSAKRLASLLTALEPGVFAATTNQPLEQRDSDSSASSAAAAAAAAAAKSALAAGSPSLFSPAATPFSDASPLAVGSARSVTGNGVGAAASAKKKLVFAFGMRLALARLAAMAAVATANAPVSFE